MIRAWKKELWKALHNPLFYTALAIGLGVALTDVVQSRLYADEWLFNQKNFYYLPNGVKWGGGSIEANGLFDNWIGAGLNNLAQIVYYVALPLLAAMAYGWAELTEKKSGYRNQLCVRETVRVRLLSRYLAAFTAGGTVAAVPLIVNVLIGAMVLPAAVSSPTSMHTPMNNLQFGSLLYFEYPWLFVLLSIVLVFFWGGAFCCLSLAAGMFLRNRILTVFSPFLCCLALEMGYQTGVIQTETELSPIVLMHLVTMQATSGAVVLGEIGILILLSFGIFWIGGKREEGL